MFPFHSHHPCCPYCQRPMHGTPGMPPNGSPQMEAELCLRDNGPYPLVLNIEEATLQNDYFRMALWTGTHLQVTLMSIQPGECIGLEKHPDVDQFLRLEQGQGFLEMGLTRDQLTYRRPVEDDDAIIIPAGYWHNLTNTRREPLKLYSIYAPPNHPFGTIHRTKADAMKG